MLRFAARQASRQLRVPVSAAVLVREFASEGGSGANSGSRKVIVA